uniref:Uncharacterized protein n=1 Tax=Knipowitschia caucasica TaxID=637954 RepID=A0AAV2K9S8_KNICA
MSRVKYRGTPKTSCGANNGVISDEAKMSTKRKAPSRPGNMKTGKFQGEVERDSGFSDASSEHLNTTDSEDSPGPARSSKPSARLTVLGGSYPSLSPMIIMNNVVLKQPADPPPALKPWRFSPAVDVVQPVVQQPQVVFLQPVTLLSDSKSAQASQLDGEGNSDVRRKRFCNTYNILSQSGLLDITLRTKELLRQNKRTQTDIHRLKEHTDLFLHALRSGDTSICVKLQATLREEEKEQEKEEEGKEVKAD